MLGRIRLDFAAQASHQLAQHIPIAAVRSPDLANDGFTSKHSLGYS